MTSEYGPDGHGYFDPHESVTKNYEPHELRVIEEETQLNERLNKLDAFISSNELFYELEENVQTLLIEQRVHMRGYSAVLAKRIAGFNPS